MTHPSGIDHAHNFAQNVSPVRVMPGDGETPTMIARVSIRFRHQSNKWNTEA